METPQEPSPSSPEQQKIKIKKLLREISAESQVYGWDHTPVQQNLAELKKLYFKNKNSLSRGLCRLIDAALLNLNEEDESNS
jgi:hypothetical protein